AALGIDRAPALEHEASQALAAGKVGGESLGVQLGIAATEVEPVDARRLGVRERAPLDQVRPRLAQQIEVVAVVELERDVRRYADRRARAWRRHRRSRQ